MNFRMVLLFFIVNIGFSQDNYDKIKVSDSVTAIGYHDYFKTITFNIGGGVFIPQGKLATYFKPSPLIEFNFDFPLKKEKSITFVAQFTVPKHSKEFMYKRDVDTVKANGTFMLNGFIRLKESIYKQKNVKLSAHLGVGMSTLYTNARNVENSESKYEQINSLLVSPGIELTYRYKTNGHFIFGLDLQYSPYRMEGALDEDIGQFVIIPRLMYRF